MKALDLCKPLAASIVLAMVFTFISCSNNEEEEGGSNGNTYTSTLSSSSSKSSSSSEKPSSSSNGGSSSEVSSSSNGGSSSSSSSDSGPEVPISGCSERPVNAWEFCANEDNNIYDLCGGINKFDPTNQKCGAGNIVVTKCGTGNNYHNPATEFCNGNEILSKCKGNVYNPNQYGCCNNTQYTLADNLRCENSIIETKCGTDWYNAANANLRCQSNVVETKCGTGWYNAVNQRCGTGNVVETKCGTDWYDATTKFCNGNSIYGKCGGNDYDPSTYYCKNGTTPTQYDGSVTYAGQTYKTIVIGTQVWMAENLNYNATGSKCYNNESANCEKYGRLYDWATAMNLPQSCNSQLVTNCGGQVNAKHKGICPSNWHIPSHAEWITLTNYVESNSGCSSCAGTHLKSASGWSSYSGIVNSDTYGFSALPGGNGGSDGNFLSAGSLGYWWSSSEYGSYGAYYRRMYYYDANVLRDYYDKPSLYSVRCVQD